MGANIGGDYTDMISPSLKIDVQLEEPVLLEIQTITDDRGFIIPITDNIDKELLGRCYIVENYGKNVIRGLHFHRKEIKIFTIVSGAAKFVTVRIPEELAIKNDRSELLQYFSSNLNL